MNNVVKIETHEQMVARQVEALRAGKVKLYSVEEVEIILDEAIERREQMQKSAKKIVKSAKEEYDLLEGTIDD
jgi:glutamyl-tRNA reductase